MYNFTNIYITYQKSLAPHMTFDVCFWQMEYQFNFSSLDNVTSTQLERFVPTGKIYEAMKNYGALNRKYLELVASFPRGWGMRVTGSYFWSGIFIFTILGCTQG